MPGVRTRGGRGRGRGVRTRGGRRGSACTTTADVATAIAGVVEPIRGRGRNGGRAHKGTRRASATANCKKRPFAEDEIKVVDIGTVPRGEPFERPLIAKRRRTWSPTRDISPPSALSPRATTPFAPQTPPLSMEPVLELSSPALFLECDNNDSNCRPMLEPQWSDQFNFGSEPEPESSDDEGVAVRPAVPRAYRSELDTPEDEELAGTSIPLLQDPVPTVIEEEPATLVSVSSDTVGTGAPYGPNFFDFKWSSLPDPPIPGQMRREVFDNDRLGPTAPQPSIYETFVGIWDLQVMTQITTETNKYAQQLASQMLSNNNLHPNSRICDWKDTTTDELYIFFAILLVMGIVVKARICDYWNNKQDIFVTPGFQACMTLKRFQLLCRCLHFRDNEAMSATDMNDHATAKLYKIQPVLDHLNEKFQNSYNMRQNIALDESLLQWNGWLDINQFIPNKTAAVGIKTYELCESQTGFLWRFEVHAHKRRETAAPEADPLQAFTPSLVLKLLQGLEHKGHTVWMDNFYNSPALARKLKTLGFDCVGTLRTNRQFVPHELTNLTKQNMRRGQITGLTSGDVDIMVWKDQNRVATISTYHGIATTPVNGTLKPTVIHDYNLMMGGVDKKDQMLASYPIERKRTKIWYKKLFKRLLNVSVLNAYIMFKANNVIDHREFRCQLICELINRHIQPLPIRAPPAISSASTKVYSVLQHHLAEHDFMPNSKGRYRRMCVVCKDKRTTLFCVGCVKPVCLSPCFVKMHS